MDGGTGHGGDVPPQRTGEDGGTGHGGDKPFDGGWVGDESKSRGPGLAAPSPPTRSLLLPVLGVSCLGGLLQEARQHQRVPQTQGKAKTKAEGEVA